MLQICVEKKDFPNISLNLSGSALKTKTEHVRLEPVRKHHNLLRKRKSFNDRTKMEARFRIRRAY